MTQEIRECWSLDEMNFCNDLHDLLDSNDELKTGDVVYVGEAHYPKPEHLCSADDIIGMIGDRAWDIGDEHAEDYPNVSREAVQELDDLLEAWIMKHCPPNFYQVENVREYVLTKEDLEK